MIPVLDSRGMRAADAEAIRGGADQSVARSMTDSQSESVGRLSPWVDAGDSLGRPFSSRSVDAGVEDPEVRRARVGALGGQVDPLLNMARSDRHESGQCQGPVFSRPSPAQTAQTALHVQSGRSSAPWR